LAKSPFHKNNIHNGIDGAPVNPVTLIRRIAMETIIEIQEDKENGKSYIVKSAPYRIPVIP